MLCCIMTPVVLYNDTWLSAVCDHTLFCTLQIKLHVTRAVILMIVDDQITFLGDCVGMHGLTCSLYYP